MRRVSVFILCLLSFSTVQAEDLSQQFNQVYQQAKQLFTDEADGKTTAETESTPEQAASPDSTATPAETEATPESGTTVEPSFADKLRAFYDQSQVEEKSKEWSEQASEWYDSAKTATDAQIKALSEDASALYEQMKDKTDDMTQQLSEQAGELYESAKDASGEQLKALSDNASQFYEQAKTATLTSLDSTVQSFKKQKCGSKHYCRDMSSCEEAQFFYQQCGVVSLDSNGDQVPCETLCQASSEQQAGFCAYNAEAIDHVKNESNNLLLMKLYALRQGLCQMVEDELLPLDQAIQVWEQQRLMWRSALESERKS